MPSVPYEESGRGCEEIPSGAEACLNAALEDEAPRVFPSFRTWQKLVAA